MIVNTEAPAAAVVNVNFKKKKMQRNREVWVWKQRDEGFDSPGPARTDELRSLDAPAYAAESWAGSRWAEVMEILMQSSNILGHKSIMTTQFLLV